MKNLFLIITALVAIHFSAYAQTNFDFSVVCESGQTLYYQITDADAHEVAMVHPARHAWDGYARPNGEISFPSVVENDGVSYTVSAIGDSAFIHCENITGNLVIPNSVRSIGQFSFKGCHGVDGTLTLPDSLEYLGKGAFNYLHLLTGIVTIPNTLTEIDSFAFLASWSITGFEIPSSVTRIVPRSLNGSTQLEYIHVDENNPVYYSENNALIERDTKVLMVGSKNTVIPEDIVEIGAGAFLESGGTGDLVIPNSVRKIGDRAFQLSRFATIALPDSLTYIDEGAFIGCFGGGSLNLASTLTYIGKYAFAASYFQGDLRIPEGIVDLKYEAFNDTPFTRVFLPSTLEYIDDRCFSDLYRLESMTVYRATPPELHEGAFWYTNKDIPVYIPNGSLNAYINAPFWSEFTNFVEMTDGPALNSEWYYEIENENGTITYQHLECTADTTINHKDVTIIIRTNTLYDKSEHTEMTREYVYEENGVLYWWNKDLQEFTVLYNYNAEEGDEWDVAVGNEHITLHVDEVSEFIYYNIPFRSLTVSDEDNLFSGTIVCGVGHLTSFFPERLMQRSGNYGVNGIRCYWQNQELIFKLGDRDCDEIYQQYHDGIEEDGPSTPSTGSGTAGTLTVYPNPTNGVLFVETHGRASQQDQTYRISNLMGQTLMTGQITAENQQIDVSNLPEGMYFITMGDTTRKFVVR